MSLTVDKGQNITKAVEVLRETYKNLNLLFSEMDIVGKDQGFIPLTSKFLRWKSDTIEDGWLTSDFIKIYQLESEPAFDSEKLSDLKNGPIYAVEIELDSEGGYPEITASRYLFDLSKWSRMPAVSDHWLYHQPYRFDDKFEIEEEDGVWRSTPRKASVSNTYWGFQSAVGISFPLIHVQDADSIKLEIFQRLLNLPEA
ncbi:hypothetical protein G5B47_24730 [Paenibacillus sp. 7124]|uniref:Uncharacterized protein n=1 Tax=Paenibacillus apii TaxID=1850370 RepID=A0A6M1PSQ7_9BACL|nr:hypothetical protein [Paenibacillus apii]NGM85608.1 hypothetical protein [Paenibacillus apii]NJJ40702.1 hypothetical protein [Paenibacillus apii]